MEKKSNGWYYSGDINLPYGGLFLRPDEQWPDSCEFVEVIDLASAVGWNGAVMITSGVITLPTACENGKRSVDRKAILSALNCHGMTARDLHCPDARHTELYRALHGYGFYDATTTECVQLEPGCPAEFDSWTAEKFIDETDLPGYVAAQYLEV